MPANTGVLTSGIIRNHDGTAGAGNGVATEVTNFSTLSCKVNTNATWNGTITFEISLDGTNFTSIRGVNTDNGEVVSTHTTANVIDHYVFNVAGFRYWRARVSTYVAGNTTVDSIAQPVLGTPYLPSVTSSGQVPISGAGTGGTSMTDDAAFTVATTGINPVGGTYRSARDSVDDNDGGAFAMTQTRALFTSIETPLGDSAMDDANDAVRVNLVAGGGAGGTSSTDDGAFTVATDSGTPAMGLVDETAPDSADEGDAAVLRCTADRKLLTRVVGDTDGNRLDVDASGHAQVDIAASSATVTVTGDAAGSLTVDNTTLDTVGGGTEAAAQRVTIANDSTGVLSVDDNSGSLTVDGDIKNKYGTSNQSITVTLASLADGSARESTAIDNSSNVHSDALVQLKIKTGAAGVSSTGYVAVYTYGTADGGTTYSDSATGTNAAITLTSPPNATLIGIVNTVANATTYESRPMSVRAGFGGTLPEKWGIIIENQSGAALDATEGNHAKFYQGVHGQVA